MIKTANLELISCTLEHFEAALRDKQELAPMLEVNVPNSWPEFPDSIQQGYEFLRDHPSALNWWMYLFVHQRDRVLVGAGGFVGRPDAAGIVEIGYSVVPEYRRRGLASEAARGLTDYAFAHAEVFEVRAQTLPDGVASIRILKKLGMREIARDEEVVSWAVRRGDYRRVEAQRAEM